MQDGRCAGPRDAEYRLGLLAARVRRKAMTIESINPATGEGDPAPADHRTESQCQNFLALNNADEMPFRHFLFFSDD